MVPDSPDWALRSMAACPDGDPRRVEPVLGGRPGSLDA
ncbi:hypothetical protein D779_0513 [Imhoffiella purpurea]|uniref:Uncharacterized protein n=1 Tax=Imhoffiella purpurea TaxID=1249627 RepID=W9V9C7_9GAMM|nr:hypothetical protein D779_0513 [Imhoffiella purpurea]